MRVAVAVAGFGVAAGLAFAAHAMRPRPPLPVLGHVPVFALVDEHDAPYTDRSMLGHVSVVDFVFTRCTASCPRLTARMAQLEQRLAGDGDARFVSFSVDPENDTPAVLAEYAAKAHADASRWSFVTGPVDDVTRAVVLGFKVSAIKRATGANDYDVTHGDWFVLVDKNGDIRGYYPTDDDPSLDPLIDDVRRLEHGKQ